MQIAGAASLGVGRLGAFRIAIFRQCIDGRALDDAARESRAARLLSETPELLLDGARNDEPAFAALDPAPRAALERFLDDTPVHGWHRALAGTSRDDRLTKLVDIAARASDAGADAVVVAPDPGTNPRVETALSGCRLLVTSSS